MYACIVGFPKVLTECAIFYTYFLHIRLFQVPVKTLSMIEHSVCLIHRDTLQCSVHCAGVGQHRGC